MNRLSKEISPYLLQHAHNPVDWYPWGEEAFTRARTENKPIFLSIGYATCHWCHVMEGDSFEKTDVAAILNQYFVPVKVDREERPDVDAIYMRAVQAMNQRGGWPLSAVLTPDGKPFWGGTFFQRDQFKQILGRLAEVWKNKQEDIEDSAFELMEHLKMLEDQVAEEKEFDTKPLKGFLERELKAYDPEWGGFGGAPKFPPAMSLMALMRIARYQKDDQAIKAVVGTLDGMARGGMRDHVGGGFHRYSVDATWLVPHFEKMLYDNALLTLAYAEGYQVTRSDEYREVVATTLHYVMHDMQSPEGGYYSAEDADSEKTEGKFYVWTLDELKKIFNAEEFEQFQRYFTVEEKGNFHVDRRVEELEEAAGMKAVQQANILHQQKAPRLATLADPNYRMLIEKLQKVREKRIRPLRDDKILAAWNGLMIGAMAKAHKVFGAEAWLQSAQRAAHFVLNAMRKEGRLQRSHRSGQTRFNAYLEDYAGMIFGLIELYEASFDSQWLRAAFELQTKQDELFWDEINGAYFDHDGEDGTVLLRGKDFLDNATPAGNSLSAWNLLRLSAMSGVLEQEARAAQILRKTADLMERFPGSFPMMMLALDWISGQHWEVVIATDQPAQDLVWPDLSPAFSPHAVFLRADESLTDICPALSGKGTRKGRTLYYLCEKGSCQQPTDDAELVRRMLQDTPHI
ncbi:MAG TPA: thioredoxin domain-containing protein [Oligoflexus sp.]|uniref:thioredoxin domain-containing protein n=1 Tax=Oligoflexus sp. TaxID=1971216 RepID=UPI002D73F660|nr:thioredoxin domain-containing protein [Oligoflexus sp.]HYX36598.1 thioredoxin domain-containing protein [Oligoflexus sp.]